VLLSTDSSSRHGESVLRTPTKGAVLPKSTITAVSPVVRHSLGCLPSSLPASSSAPQCVKRQLVSPQITKWFRKSTPRKLAVTPKKSSAPSAAKSGVKRKLCSELDTDDSLGVMQLTPKPKVRRSSRENDPTLSPTRPQRAEPIPAANVLSPVESNCNNSQSEQMCGKTSHDSSLASDATQLSGAAAATSFRSPTVNLPNYVYDPQPRAPIGRHLSPVKRRQSRDWLTQLRLERQKQNLESSQASQSPTDRARSPARRSQAGRGTAKTSKSSPLSSQSDAASLPVNTKVVNSSCHFLSFP